MVLFFFSRETPPPSKKSTRVAFLKKKKLLAVYVTKEHWLSHQYYLLYFKKVKRYNCVTYYVNGPLLRRRPTPEIVLFFLHHVKVAQIIYCSFGACSPDFGILGISGRISGISRILCRISGILRIF